MSTLSTSQGERLAELEGVVSKGMTSFVEVGNALMAIRDEFSHHFKYLGYADFEDYCRSKWELSYAMVYRQIKGAEIVKNLDNCQETTALPTTEAQARPLTKLKTADEQREAWTLANEASNGKPTAKHVEAAVQSVKTKRSIPEPEFTPSQQKEIEQAEKDSMNLSSLKRYWRLAGKRDRAAFLAWIKMNA